MTIARQLEIIGVGNGTDLIAVNETTRGSWKDGPLGTELRISRILRAGLLPPRASASTVC